MALRTEYAMHYSGLENFLYAPIWEEPNGVTLTILSALARLGIDPWCEAARLSAMPKDAATPELAGTLARLPFPGIERPDYAEHAGRLVKFLPARSTTRPIEAQTRGEAETNGRVVPLFHLLLGVAAAIGLLQAIGWLF